MSRLRLRFLAVLSDGRGKPPHGLPGGLLAAAVLLGSDGIIVRAVSRSDQAVRLFEGQDVPLVEDGRYLIESLHREGLRRADVEAALRAQGADGAGDVAEASLSPGGSIVVWLRPARGSATRADVEAVHQRLDAIERAITGARDPVQRDASARERPASPARHDPQRTAGSTD